MRIKAFLIAITIIANMFNFGLSSALAAGGSSYWKDFADIYLEEEFDGKPYSCTTYGNAARTFVDLSGNAVWRYVSNNAEIYVVDDPEGTDNDVLRITPAKTVSGPAFWYDQNTIMSGWEDLTEKFIYEQKYYLTDDALKNGGYLMWQIYDTAGSNGQIATVAWDNGFNKSVTNNTLASSDNAYTLPRNEWFTLRAELDFKTRVMNFYVIEADGSKTIVFTNNMNSVIKGTGLGRMRVTYSENPADGKDIAVYYDDVYYYQVDASMAAIPDGYRKMTGSGTASVGAKLSVTPEFAGGVAPYDYTIQWCRVPAGMYNYLGTELTEIAGATEASYTVTESDKGCYLFAKLIVDGSSIIEGLEDVELDIYPKQPSSDWAVNVGEDFLKKYSHIYFGENFDDKAYSWTNNTGNSGTRNFADENGNIIWKYNAAAMPAVVAADPAGRSGKSLKLTADYTGSEAAKRIWLDENTDLKNNSLQGLHIYEQKIFLDDNALKNDGHLMFQFMHTANTGQILYVLRKDGFNTSNTSATPTVTYAPPRNEWFKIVTILDYQAGKYWVKVFENDGDVVNVMSANLAPQFKTNGTVRVRPTYQETVNTSFTNANVYFDDISYYATDEPMAAVANLRIEGENMVGKTLRAAVDMVGGVDKERDFAFQWYRAETKEAWDYGQWELGEDEMQGENFVPISGANDSVYTLTKADENKYIKLGAVFTSPDGGSENLWTHPQFIRPEAKVEIRNPEITLSEGTSAAVSFENKTDELYSAVMILAKYTGDICSGVDTYAFDVEKGKTETVRAPFNVGNVNDTDVLKLMVWNSKNSMCPLFEGLTMTGADIRSIPKPVINVSGDDVTVTWNGESILDIVEGRYLTFRSTTENDHWVGTKYNKGTDMGFSYQEDNICGIVNKSIETKQDEWSFTITLEGEKPIVDASQTNIIEGRWNPKMKGFEYKYTGVMRAHDTADYHQKSTAGWASAGSVEFLDYFLERMSIQDRTLNNNHNGDLYDYIAFTNGNGWEKLPKLSVFYDYVRDGNYYASFYLNKGDKVAVVDANANGWTSELLHSSHDMRIGLCWSWYDIHYVMENAVPSLGSCDDFEVSASWLFVPTTVEENQKIIAEANEPDWKNNINYDLPRYSSDWNNKFDTQVGGTQWEEGMAWSRTDYDCYWDKEVGYDDNYSVAFDRDANSKTYSTWFNSCYFGHPAEFFETKNKTFRVTAMVKTENLTGEAKLSIANGRGNMTIPGYRNGDPESAALQYVYADSLTGTNDWTPVSLEFTGKGGNARYYLTYIMMTVTGEGKAWFDNVQIECLSE